MPAVSLQAQIPAIGQASKVVFLEHYLTANGTVVNGTVQFRSVNFPSYWFNENRGQIHGPVDFLVNDSLQMIFGDVLTLQGNFGGGTGNKLFGVYSFPVTANEAYIYGVDAWGNVLMRVNQKALLLGPGESYTYFENETVRDGGAIIRVRYNHTYVNHGLIDKKNILYG